MIRVIDPSLLSISRRRLLAGACMLGLVPATAALAQSTPVASAQTGAPMSQSGATTRLDEVVVTAQRRSERLQDVPIAVTALNANALKAAGIDGAADLAKAVPGLSFNTQLGGFGQPRIRGIGVAASGPGLENPVATYIDGVYYGSASSVLFDLADVSQVAVLKGPQGTLFGRNATGGLIQVTTKDPSQAFHLDLDGTIGNEGANGADAYIAGGLTSKLAASLSLRLDDQDDGFGKNIPTNQDIQTHHGYAGRGKVLFQPDDNTRLTLSADYSYRRSSDFALRIIGDVPNIGQLAAGGGRDTDLNSAPLSVSRQEGVSLNAQHDFSGVRLISITAYRDTRFSTAFDGDESPLDFINVVDNNTARQFSQELQLLSTGGHRFTWQAGAFYFREKDTLDPFDTLITYPEALPARDDINDSEKLTSYAGYGQGTYKLGYATDFTAGLRYTVDERSHDVSNTYSTAYYSVPTTPPVASKNFYKLTWRFSLDHHFSPSVLGYISDNRGFKSGTFDPQAIPTVEIKPETLDAYEIGLKSDYLDHRIRLNVAGFYYDYTNIQVSQFAQNREFVYNGQGATSYGLDLDVVAKATSELTFDGGLALIHARYDQFQNAFKTVPNPAGGNIISLTDDATGNELQNTPSVTVNLGATYRKETDLGGFTFASNYYYNGGYYSEPENRLHQSPYSVVDSSLSWNSLNKMYDVRIWGKNLTDTLYPAQLAAIDSGDVRIAAPGRTFGVTVGLHF